MLSGTEIQAITFPFLIFPALENAYWWAMRLRQPEYPKIVLPTFLAAFNLLLVAIAIPITTGLLVWGSRELSLQASIYSRPIVASAVFGQLVSSFWWRRFV